MGEAFDPTGLVVTVTYADNTTEDVTADCAFSPTTISASTMAVTITYNRAGRTLTATQAVTVRQLQSNPLPWTTAANLRTVRACKNPTA